MVNSCARHESTCISGKIQCSSVLYEHLAEYSGNDNGPMYEFTDRGYVDMKGKGRCYTYWLDRGGKHNELASPEAIEELRKDVNDVLSKKKWRRRQYLDFRRRRSSILDSGENGDENTLETGAKGAFADYESLVTASRARAEGDAFTDVARSERSQRGGTSVGVDSVYYKDAVSAIVSSADDGVNGAAEVVDGNGDATMSDHDTASFVQLKRTPWSDIKWDPNLSRIDLVAAIHGLLSSMLWKCAAEVLSELPDNKAFLDHELARFVDRISSLYVDHPFHSWGHACQVVLSATYLIKEYDKTKDEAGCPIENNPCIRFITVFAAMIHDVKHLGVPNAQLKTEDHPLTQVYCQGSYQERQSIQVALSIFVEEFPELSSTVFNVCPLFSHLITSAVLATDVASSDVQGNVQKRFERVMIVEDDDATELDKTLVVVEQLLLLADVGHCSQSYENFLTWNRAFFHECVKDYHEGRGMDPRPGWFEGQIGFLEGYIIPLAERCDHIIPQCELTKGTRRILRMWKKDGKEWTDNIVEQSLKAEEMEKERLQALNSSTHKQGQKQSSERRSSGARTRRFSLFKSKKSLRTKYAPDVSQNRRASFA